MADEDGISDDEARKKAELDRRKNSGRNQDPEQERREGFARRQGKDIGGWQSSGGEALKGIGKEAGKTAGRVGGEAAKEGFKGAAKGAIKGGKRGAQMGGAAGSAIGGAIGSVVPGAGTAAGASIGKTIGSVGGGVAGAGLGAASGGAKGAGRGAAKGAVKDAQAKANALSLNKNRAGGGGPPGGSLGQLGSKFVPPGGTKQAAQLTMKVARSLGISKKVVIWIAILLMPLLLFLTGGVALIFLLALLGA